MVYDLIGEIFKRYEIEKNNSFLNNDFINEMNEKFYDSFDKFISDLVSLEYKGKYATEIDFGEKDWNEYPIIKIYYDKISSTTSKGLYIYLLLNTSVEELEFGLRLDDSNFKNISNKSFINYIYNCIEDDNIRINESEYKIILNENDLGVLENNLLGKELEPIIKKFEGLLNLYICYVFEHEIKGITTYAEENESLNITFKDLSEELPESFEINDKKIKEICSAFNSNNIILKGVPGTGKTFIAEHLASLGLKNNFVNGYLLTTATSDWSTYDTIGGLIPVDDGKLAFKPGKFLEAIESNKWLIIDEINRADIDKAFGQLFTVLSGYDVELPYKDSKGNPIKIIRNKNSNKSYHDPVSGSYVIGNNWRIIGTMNTVDKDTLYDLSYAFMRRFMFVDIDVPYYDDQLKEKWINKHFHNEIDEDYSNEIKGIWDVSDSVEFGPAIYDDLLKYIHNRIEMEELKLIDEKINESEMEKNEKMEILYSILASGINAYIIPQIEGSSDIGHVKNRIRRYFEAYYKDNPSVNSNEIDKILDNILIGNLII